jgi:hypothetical protein
LKISYQLTEQDILLAQSETRKRYRASLVRGWQTPVLLWGGALTFGMAFAASLGMYRFHSGSVTRDFSFVLVPACVGVILTFAYLMAVRRASLRAHLDAAGPLPLAASVTLTDNDVELASQNGRAIVPFDRVVASSMTPTHVLIVLRPWSVIVIPRVAFDNDETCARFVACVRDRAGL